MKRDKAELFGVVAGLVGILVVVALLGLGVAAFGTWVAGMFFDYPMTWVNVGKAWLAITALNLVLTMVRK